MLKQIALLIIGLLHLGFLILESFLWTKPMGRKIFRLTPEKAQLLKVMAFNQGFYNGFLAAGLFWAAFSDDRFVSLFFLSCVVVAGIVGGASVSRSIYFIQALPALVALGLVLAGF
jgi:putative membrane protein